MEIVVTKMRSFATAAAPSLRSLTDADAPGERLAAIAVLQAEPREEYVEWLGKQCLDRQPFLAYHAAVALLTSVRALDSRSWKALELAINIGLIHLEGKPNTDRYRTLKNALKELDGRRGVRQ